MAAFGVTTEAKKSWLSSFLRLRVRSIVPNLNYAQDCDALQRSGLIQSYANSYNQPAGHVWAARLYDLVKPHVTKVVSCARKQTPWALAPFFSATIM